MYVWLNNSEYKKMITATARNNELYIHAPNIHSSTPHRSTPRN